MTLRVLIVDDEAPARRRIRRLLLRDPDVTVIGECGDGVSALSAITAAAPDLVFLDVQMPEADGFEVVASLPSKPTAVLFVTAHDRYALRAFDAHAVDYLLKPFTEERFRTALARARERIAARTADPALASLVEDVRNRRLPLARLPVRTNGRTIFVDLSQVDWLEAADNYVPVHGAGGRAPRRHPGRGEPHLAAAAAPLTVLAGRSIRRTRALPRLSCALERLDAAAREAMAATASRTSR